MSVTRTEFTVQLTSHAVRRFQERVRPGLSLTDAEDELGRLVLAGSLAEDPPAWHLANCAQIAPYYLCAADILLPLKLHWCEHGVLVATTCLPKGTLSEAARHRRTRRRRARRRSSRLL
jgi:hypothetical protein